MRILVGEPTPEVRELLVRLLELLGHDPAVSDGHAVSPLPDVFVFEPSCETQLELARELRRLSPDVRLVACSINDRTPELAALEPVAHLLKPFRRSELAAALEAE